MNEKWTWYSTTEDRQWEQIDLTGLECLEDSDDTLEITESRYQTIDGFGGCFNELGWIALSKISEDQRNDILDELFLTDSGCKFNFCRIPIGASDYAAEWYSLNETADDYEMKNFTLDRDRKYLLPYIKESLKRRSDMKFFASPWSPPAWMKFPKAYNYGTLVWDKKTLDAYALYFLKFVEEYQKEGVLVNQIHVQNEPAHDHKFPSCLWTGDQFREFIGDYLGPFFEKNGLETEIWLGTINAPELGSRKLQSDYDHYANLVLSDKKAGKYVKGVSYQWEGKNVIQRTNESWPEIKLMQSENECGDGNNTWEYAHYVFGLFRHYLRNGVGSYIYWNMVLETGGTSTWGWNQNSLVSIDPNTKEVTFNPEFYVMKHFSHFIEPGAVRLGTKGHYTGNSIAFENPDGSIIIVVNNGMNKERSITLKGKDRKHTAKLKPYSINTFII